MKKQKRVLIIAGALEMGGLENQLVYLARHVEREKIELDYTSTKENAYYKSDIIDSQCGYIVVPDPRQVGLLRYCLHMYRVMKNGRYDVVHSQELFHSGIEMFLAWLAGIPKRISHSHSTRDGSKRNKIIKKIYHIIMQQMILVFGTDYLACSTMAGKFLYGTKIVEHPKFKVVFNSVDTSEYFCNRDNSLMSFEKKDGWKYVIHVGRFADVKNHKFMIEMARHMQQKAIRIGFVFVGDGELYETIQEQIIEEELSEYIQLLGKRKDVAELLKQSDAFILPSFYEGMPLSVIEAQTAGLPCLIAEHITDEVDFGIGRVQKLPLDCSADIWVDQLVELTQVPQVDSDIIKQAIAEKGFDVSAFQQALCNIYMKE